MRGAWLLLSQVLFEGVRKARFLLKASRALKNRIVSMFWSGSTLAWFGEGGCTTFPQREALYELLSFSNEPHASFQRSSSIFPSLPSGAQKREPHRAEISEWYLKFPGRRPCSGVVVALRRAPGTLETRGPLVSAVESPLRLALQPGPNNLVT